MSTTSIRIRKADQVSVRLADPETCSVRWISLEGAGVRPLQQVQRSARRFDNQKSYR